jgi:hypothetical protein
MRGARLSAFDGTGNCFLGSRTSACESFQLSDLIDSILFFPSERPEHVLLALSRTNHIRRPRVRLSVSSSRSALFCIGLPTTLCLHDACASLLPMMQARKIA